MYVCRGRVVEVEVEVFLTSLTRLVVAWFEVSYAELTIEAEMAEVVSATGAGGGSRCREGKRGIIKFGGRGGQWVEQRSLLEDRESSGEVAGGRGFGKKVVVGRSGEEKKKESVQVSGGERWSGRDRHREPPAQWGALWEGATQH